MQAVTLTGTEQALGTLMLLGAAFVAVTFGGGYTWYRLVSYPRARRGARELGFVVVGENVFGDSLLIEWSEADWRAATFKEWRSADSGALWPTRTFADDEIVC